MKKQKYKETEEMRSSRLALSKCTVTKVVKDKTKYDRKKASKDIND